MPFHLAGVHSDNGSEFINHRLAKWCTTRNITFTRSRAANRNDNAHVEQKNWSIVRRCVGYYRYDTPREIELCNRLWAVETPVTNLFQTTTKSSPRRPVTARKWSRPTITAWRRWTGSSPAGPTFDPADVDRLLAQRDTNDLLAARRDVAAIQDQLTWHAKRRGPVPNRPNQHHVYDSKPS